MGKLVRLWCNVILPDGGGFIAAGQEVDEEALSPALKGYVLHDPEPEDEVDVPPPPKKKKH